MDIQVDKTFLIALDEAEILKLKKALHDNRTVRVPYPPLIDNGTVDTLLGFEMALGNALAQ